ncbi:MAG: VOC family protein [Actinomycetales bacterium]|nr:VOC family protein [Actinomycetales bacterium]
MIGELAAIALDTEDAEGLAAFYVEILELQPVWTSDDWILMATPEGWAVAFQRVDHHLRPRWPDPVFPQQMHLELLVADLTAVTTRAVQAGATRLPGGDRNHVVLADPAGHPFCLWQSDEVERVRLAGVCVDCPDGSALARFYGPLFGMEITDEGPDGALLSTPGKPAVGFQNVAGYLAPRWPDPAHPQQVHLAAKVTDLDAAEPRVLALGATRLPGGGDTFRVFADPVGHPFCLVL